uniref:PDZ domain-containing protein n=1 Tax=Gadus morhua TaxID=8049 RepID=A0A8C5BTU6_GADMO
MLQRYGSLAGQLLMVELEKDPRGPGLGSSSLVSSWSSLISNDTGIFVSEILHQGVADKDGRLLLGDQILSINGEDVRAGTFLVQMSAFNILLIIKDLFNTPFTLCVNCPWNINQSINFNVIAEQRNLITL